MTDTSTTIGLALLISLLCVFAFCLGCIYGINSTIHQLAREINERNSARKAGWLKRQHRERDIA